MGSNPSPDGRSSNQGKSRHDGIEENSENRFSKNSIVKEGESSRQSRHMLRRAQIKEQKELQTKSKEYKKSSSTRTEGAPDQE